MATPTATTKALRSRFSYRFSGKINWYPGHMAKATRLIQDTLKAADMVLEVRDARIPFSSANPTLEELIKARQMPHLLLLHKADLADPSFEAEIVDHFAKYKNKQALFTSSVLSTKSNNINNLANIIPAAIDLYLRSKQQKQSSSASSSSASSSAGSTPSSPSPLPPQKKELMLMIVGVPNVGKSTLINKLRAVNNLRTASAKTGPLPGVTRGLNCFKVSERPVAAYLMDTPGIMMPRIHDVEVGLKLSLVGAIKESVVGKKAIADYLLYSMNRLGNRSYLHTKTLLSRPSSQQQAQPQQKDEQQKDEQEDEPTDDINAVLLSIARRIGA